VPGRLLFGFFFRKGCAGKAILSEKRKAVTADARTLAHPGYNGRSRCGEQRSDDDGINS
jgi:hypothetical protein